MMWKYFTGKQTYKWIDILDKLIKQYNNKVHSSIKMTPAEAIEPEGVKILENRIEKTLYSQDDVPKAKLKIGDKVRISKVKGKFEKGYEPNWSAEIFTITKIKPTDPTTYIITDHEGEEIKGSFYNQELLKSSVPDVFLIEKTLKSRNVKGKKQYLVKWLGFEKPEWVDEDKFVQLNSE
jgi:hypothetical protein